VLLDEAVLLDQTVLLDEAVLLDQTVEAPGSGLLRRPDYESERAGGGGQTRTERRARSTAWATRALDIICTTPPSSHLVSGEKCNAHAGAGCDRSPAASSARTVGQSPGTRRRRPGLSSATAS